MKQTLGSGRRITVDFKWAPIRRKKVRGIKSTGPRPKL